MICTRAAFSLFSDSIYRDMISNAILKLQEEQKIQVLYNKWWRESDGAGTCVKPSAGKANELGVKNVGGVFVVLMVGLVMSTLCAIIEFIWKARKRADKDQVSSHRLSHLSTVSLWFLFFR